MWIQTICHSDRVHVIQCIVLKKVYFEKKVSRRQQKHDNLPSTYPACEELNLWYNPFLVYCRELAPGTVSLTGDRAQGDDSKYDSNYNWYSC